MFKERVADCIAFVGDGRSAKIESTPCCVYNYFWPVGVCDILCSFERSDKGSDVDIDVFEDLQ